MVLPQLHPAIALFALIDRKLGERSHHAATHRLPPPAVRPLLTRPPGTSSESLKYLIIPARLPIIKKKISVAFPTFLKNGYPPRLNPSGTMAGKVAYLPAQLVHSAQANPMPQVALIYPQIPPNTGNIARTCAATGTPLHLVGPLGFEISDRTLKRAGLDYWPYVDVHYHETLAAFQAVHAQQGGRWIGFATKGAENYIHFHFRADDWLLFGSETEGLPADVLALCQATVYIPMAQSQVRSLNLSVSAALGLFEAHRQLGYLG